jgi:hypothetical protein
MYRANYDCYQKGGSLAMAEPREELKGRLLVLWLEDLRNDQVPQRHPEMALLSTSDVEEVMGLARFIKGSFYPSAATPRDMESFTEDVSRLLSVERAKEEEMSRSAVEKARSFADLIRQMIVLFHVDRSALRELLNVPASTLSELEGGELPPHRLPVEKLIRLLCALRLTSTGVIGLIRKSSLDWAEASSQKGSARLGRVDEKVSDKERAELMDEQGQPMAAEVGRVNKFCSALSRAIEDLK